MRLSTIGALLTLTLAFALLVAPRTTNAQQPEKVPHVGILSFSSAEPSPGRETFRLWGRGLEEGLRDHGYVEGQNIRVERRSADQRAPGSATSLASSCVSRLMSLLRWAMMRSVRRSTPPRRFLS